MKKVILDDLLVEKVNDERFVLHGIDKAGKQVALQLSAHNALQLARLLLNWVCEAWLE